MQGNARPSKRAREKKFLDDDPLTPQAGSEVVLIAGFARNLILSEFVIRASSFVRGFGFRHYFVIRNLIPAECFARGKSRMTNAEGIPKPESPNE
jgi:hypothetical protein